MFKSAGNTILNPSRVNCYCSVLRLRKVGTDLATSPNKFLTYRSDPVLCTSFVIVNGCNLLNPRTYGNLPIYEVKDVQVRFLRYELERMTSFFGYLAQASAIYYNGVTIPMPCINVGVRFNMVKPADGIHLCLLHLSY